MLNKRLEEVPDFASASGIEWWDSLYGWCIENGYGLILLDANTKHLITNTYGIGVCKIKESDDETHAVILQYSLDQKGEQWTYKADLYHDPNPKGVTILEVQHHIFITRVTPQQPSEPLKELDEEAILMVLDQCCPVSMDEMAKEMIAQILWNKFGQPSEKKALSREELTKLVDEETKQMFDDLIFITKKMEEAERQYFEAKNALPARKEVKWPEKESTCYCDDSSATVDLLPCSSCRRNSLIDACKKAYEEAVPAQREVRYPEKLTCYVVHERNVPCVICYEYMGHNNAIDKFKKLNGG